MCFWAPPTPRAASWYGLTVTEGDPSWAGVLAGVSLELPVYHITEPEIKSQVDPEVYQEQVGLTEMVLDTEDIFEALRGGPPRQPVAPKCTGHITAEITGCPEQ